MDIYIQLEIIWIIHWTSSWFEHNFENKAFNSWSCNFHKYFFKNTTYGTIEFLQYMIPNISQHCFSDDLDGLQMIDRNWKEWPLLINVCI